MALSPGEKLLALTALTIAALACANPLATPPPAVFLIIEPESGISASPDQMKQAGEIIKRRLEAAHLYNGMDVSDDRITIYLDSHADPEVATMLAVDVGSIEFFGSDTALDPGSVAPGLGQPILMEKDIDSASIDETSGFYIRLTFTADGSKKVADYTTGHSGWYMVIVWDGIVLTSPGISNPITDGVALFDWPYDKAEADYFIIELTEGRLPFKTHLAEVGLLTPAP